MVVWFGLRGSPVRAGGLVLIIAFTRSLTVRLVSSWFGFGLSIIYVGGLMVLFSYFISLSPNQRFSLTGVFWGIFVSYFFIMCCIEVWVSVYQHTGVLWGRGSPIVSLLEFNGCYVLGALVFVLFLALVVVVKLVGASSGPLRPF